MRVVSCWGAGMGCCLLRLGLVGGVLLSLWGRWRLVLLVWFIGNGNNNNDDVERFGLEEESLFFFAGLVL